MEAKLYSVSGLFETGTEIATFDRSREGLEQAYDFVGNAFAWQIKCGSELVDECDPWKEDDEAEAETFVREPDEAKARTSIQPKFALAILFF